MPLLAERHFKKNWIIFERLYFQICTYLPVSIDKIINISNILWKNLNSMFVFLYVAFFIIEYTHKNKQMVHFSQIVGVRYCFYFELVYFFFQYNILNNRNLKINRYRLKVYLELKSWNELLKFFNVNQDRKKKKRKKI